MQKFKDKKTLVVEENHKSLEKFIECVNLEDVSENLKEILIGEKIPVLKINALIWFEKYIEKTRLFSKKINPVKNFTIFLARKIIEDNAIEVRKFSFEILAKIKANFLEEFGENFLLEFFTGNKLIKFNELTNSIINKNKLKEDFNFIQNPLENNNKIQLEIANKNSKKALFVDKKKENIFNKAKNDINKFDFKYYSIEEAINILQYNNQNLYIFLIEKWKNDIHWKEKIELIKNLPPIFKENIKNVQENEALLIILKNKLKDWKESNLSVLKPFFDFLLFLFEEYNQEFINKKLFFFISFPIFDKMGDVKFSELIYILVKKICLKIPTKFVVLTFCFIFSNNQKHSKKIKIQSDLCLIFSKIVKNESIESFPLNEVIDFAKNSINIPQVKNSGLILLKTLYLLIGSKFESFFSDFSAEKYKIMLNELELQNIDEKVKSLEKVKIIQNSPKKSNF